MDERRGKLNYNFSRDYKKLWELINNGERIVGFIEFNDRFYDVVSIFILDGRYKIGYRGCGYEGFEQKFSDFYGVCEEYSLVYIPCDRNEL